MDVCIKHQEPIDTIYERYVLLQGQRHCLVIISLFPSIPCSGFHSIRCRFHSPAQSRHHLPDRDHGQGDASNRFQSGSKRFDPSPLRYHQVDRPCPTNCPSIPEPRRFCLHLSLPACLLCREHHLRKRPLCKQNRDL